MTGRPESVPRDLQAIDIPPSTSTTTTTTLPPTTTTTSTTTTTTDAPATTDEATVEEPTTTEVTTTTTTLLPERSVVVVVANASDTLGLASRTSAQLRELGYVDVSHTDGLRELPETTIYFAEGFEGEARRLARQIGVPLRLVEPRPDGPLYKGNVESQLLVMLGNDWSEVTNLNS